MNIIPSKHTLSLRKHSCDVNCNKKLFKSNILAFTETQLLPEDNDFDIVQSLTPFTLYRYDHNSNKFCSLATAVKNNAHILNQEYFPALNAFKFVVTYDTNNVEGPLNLSLLLVYRKMAQVFLTLSMKLLIYLELTLLM